MTCSQVNAGKPQLRIEEARRFTPAAIGYFEETQRPLAIGALLALTMGLRTGEVLDRVVRDLDDGARYLWIDAGKTANARRHLEVPELVQPYLLRLAAGKRPDEHLFGESQSGGRRYSQKMWEMVNAATARVLGGLGSTGEAKRPSARAQLENLDEDTLAQLLALLAETKKGGAPAN